MLKCAIVSPLRKDWDDAITFVNQSSADTPQGPSMVEANDAIYSG